MCHQDVVCVPDPQEGEEYCKAVWENKERKQDIFVPGDDFLLGEDSLQHIRSEPTNMSHFPVESSVSVVGQQPDEGF